MALIEPNRKRSRSPDCEADGVDITTTARARKPTNSTPIDVSSGSGENWRMALTPSTIATAAMRGAERGAESDDRCDGDAGQHAVGEGVAEEGHPAQHHPRADERRRHRR